MLRIVLYTRRHQLLLSTLETYVKANMVHFNFSKMKGVKIHLSSVNTLTQFWLVCTALLVRVLCPLSVFGCSKGAQRGGRGVPYSLRWLHRSTSFSPVPLLTALPTILFYCVALVMPFSRDTILELSMRLTRLSGAKGLREPLVSQLLGGWVASSPLAKARWYEASEVAQLLLIRNNQIEAVKQYASVLFAAPE